MFDSYYLTECFWLVLWTSGPLFFSYLAYRVLIVAIAKGGEKTGLAQSPAALLVTAYFGSFIWIGLSALVIWTFAQLFLSPANNLILLLIPFVLSAPIGIVRSSAFRR